jgi:hypothetical protein
MLSKITGLARLVNIVLAVVAGLVVIPGLDVTLALIVIGLVAGLTTTRDQMTNLLIAAITLPVLGGVLANLPTVGGYLNDIFVNFGIAVTGHAAMGVVLTVYHLVVGDLKGLTAK